MKDNITAIVLAGGKGSRLFPITADCPKPLVKINNISALERIYKSISKAGITDVRVTVCHMAEMLEKKQYAGLDIKYVRECRPLGSAGGVKNAAAGARGILLILCADAVFDFDLLPCIKSHMDSKAKITLLLTKHEDPTRYGIAHRNGSSIDRFTEKPSWENVYSNLVNTGIYIINRELMEYIPDGKPFDFSRDLFPLLLSEGIELNSHAVDGYWCDIGTPMSYYECNMIYSSGKNVIGDSCDIAATAKINASVLGDGVTVGDNSVINGAVICDNAKIGNNVMIRHNAVIGGGCNIGDGSVIGESVQIAPRTVTGSGMTVTENIMTAEDMPYLFDESGKIGRHLNISAALRLGQSLSAVFKGHGIGILIGDNYSGNGTAEALMLGLGSGSRPLSLGSSFRSMAPFACRVFKLQCCVYIDDCGIALYTDGGGYLDDKVCAAVEEAYRCKSFADVRIIKPLSLERELKTYYYNHLVKTAAGLFTGAVISTENPPSQFLKTSMLRRTRFRDSRMPDGKFFISDDGESVYALSRRSEYFSRWHILLSVMLHEAELGQTHFELPGYAPAALINTLDNAGCSVTANCGNSKNYQLYMLDGATLLLKFLIMLQEKDITMSSLYAQLPRFFVKNTIIAADENKKSELISRFAEKYGVSEGRVCKIGSRGRVTILPTRFGAFRLIAETASSEIADELFAETENEINR